MTRRPVETEACAALREFGIFTENRKALAKTTSVPESQLLRE